MLFRSTVSSSGSASLSFRSKNLDETFEFIDKMNVTHISAYMLKIEKGTRFFDLKDRLALPDEDTVCEMYLKTIKSLEALGFNQYEISNFYKA